MEEQVEMVKTKINELLIFCCFCLFFPPNQHGHSSKEEEEALHPIAG